MNKHYSDELSSQILIALLKAHAIRKVIASPGTTNMSFVASIQNDPYFEIYSSVDERSAAYIACGLATESGEPVVLSCTGATASRNYGPGLTEAYYRKIPLLAITATQIPSRAGHLVAQVIDRSVVPNDVAKISLTLPVVRDKEDFWECEIKINQAILELKRAGGGPVHLNMPTLYSKNYSVRELPQCRVIQRYSTQDLLPQISGKVAIFAGSRKPFTIEETSALDAFCEKYNAVVFCDHTSNYFGKYRTLFALAAGQEMGDLSSVRPDILIHIGEVTGDYESLVLTGKEVWRVSEDGEIRDPFRRLRYVFEMSEYSFFMHYAQTEGVNTDGYYEACQAMLQEIRGRLPELPFSNIWLAARTAHLIPRGAHIHFGILNSLRSWNFFELDSSIRCSANVGGFGIDGALSTMLGISLACPERTVFCVLGDLAFFYDMNSLGNRHLGNNLRILLVNNGKGTEFRQYNHRAADFGPDADKFISAAGHYGRKSSTLVKNYAESLGFKYLSASDKKQFESNLGEFIDPESNSCPIIMEVFTDSDEESEALKMIKNVMKGNIRQRSRKALKAVLGYKAVSFARKVVKS